MSDERMRILEMVREGKITTDEAVRLLAAPKGAGSAGETAPAGGEHSRHHVDPIGGIVDTVTEVLTGRGWPGFGRGWSGPWGNWGGPEGQWHSGWHGGWLRGQ